MMEDKSCCVSAAVCAPVNKLFTYSVPEPLQGQIEIGQLVEVPFGKSARRAVVCGPTPPVTETLDLKPLGGIVEPKPVLAGPLLRTLLRAANYYLLPPGELFFAALPPSFRGRENPGHGHRVLAATVCGSPAADQRLGSLQQRLWRRLQEAGQAVAVTKLESEFPGARAALRHLAKKGLVYLAPTTVERRPPPPAMPAAEEVLELNPHQRQALTAICAALDARENRIFLLQGVTGSGKTEVYLQAIRHVLAQGRGALLLVPEIALTPQLLARVTARLGDQVAVLHSGLSAGERADEWRRLWLKRARVAVGTRSAVFAPVERLGLIVVDEEQDSSYKQSETLPYNGRDLALLRAQEEGAVALLGSATPSLESEYRVRQGKLQRLRLPERVLKKPLPHVRIVDLRKELGDPIERQHVIGSELAQALAETLDRGEQAILFLNRRGYASFALCRQCGGTIRCPNCSVALVYHRAWHRLRCHYCDASLDVPEKCPSCGAGRLQLFGLGTEKCEQEVRRRFPGARILRLDTDAAASRQQRESILSRFAAGAADVLVGTQMVTKGHDIPGVTLVGVVLADLGLNLPDFRAFERTFQHLVQVSGRAGRGEKPGLVLVQTFVPEHPCLRQAATQQVDDFLRQELERRERSGFPPHRHLLMVRVSHPRAECGRALAESLAKKFIHAGGRNLQLLGPAPSPLGRLHNRYRFQMLVLSTSRRELLRAAASVQSTLRRTAGARVVFDVDPQDML